MTQPGATTKYFAYASTLSRQYMKEHCPDAKPLFTAVLPNYRMVFSGWSREYKGGLATIISYHGEKVRGAVYEVTDICLRKLDRWQTGYIRQKFTVFDEDNEPHQAITYVKAGQLDKSLPSKEYAAIIKQGYRDWGIG